MTTKDNTKNTNHGEQKFVDLFASRRQEKAPENLEHHYRPVFLHDQTPSPNCCRWDIPWKSSLPTIFLSKNDPFASYAK